jgi:hypothetical protein
MGYCNIAFKLGTRSFESRKARRPRRRESGPRCAGLGDQRTQEEPGGLIVACSCSLQVLDLTLILE